MDTCKICGAARDPLNTNCKFCGTAYQLEKLTGETYINALRTVLAHIDEGEGKSKSASSELVSAFTGKQFAGADAKVSAISTFAMPSDVENLLQFLAFCHGNAQMALIFGDRGGERVRGAWLGKAKMAFTQLKMKSIGNPSLVSYIAEYEPLYGVKAKKPISSNIKVLIGLVGGLIVLMTFIGIMASGESKGEDAERQRLTLALTTVQRLIVAEQYSAAEATCAEIHWTYEPNYSSSKELVKQYDQTRDALVAQIQAARQNSKAK
jgi:hypothetical protein